LNDFKHEVLMDVGCYFEQPEAGEGSGVGVAKRT